MAQNDPDSYSLEEEMPVGEREGNSVHSYINPWLILLRLFLSPLKAWKMLKNSTLRPDDVASTVFYPLIGVASLSTMLKKIYFPTMTLGQLLEGAIGVFIAFFVGYFLLLVCCRLFLPGDGKVKIETPYGKMWLQYLIATLTIFYTLCEAFPMIEPVLVFTPLFTIFLAIRGVRFLRLKAADEAPVGWSVGILTIAIPYAVYSLFEWIAPNT